MNGCKSPLWSYPDIAPPFLTSTGFGVRDDEPWQISGKCWDGVEQIVLSGIVDLIRC